MPAINMNGFADIQRAVHQLKIERDTWQAVALQYKEAFEDQTSRLKELQDICFAAQAELENERAQQHQLRAISDQSGGRRPTIIDSAEDIQPEQSFGTAVILSPRKPYVDHHRLPSNDCANPLFEKVQQSIAQRNYGSALVQVEQLLRGPLSSKNRAEALLLKSEILRASGPDELYDALAACSEALELCERLSELEAFLPRLQCQRSILYYDLRILHQTREYSSMIGNDDLHLAKAEEHRRSCDSEIDQLRVTKRRSGFDENRTMTEGLLARLKEKGCDNKRRRASTQLRQYAAAKAKRMSLPHRWVNSKTDGH